MQHDNMRSLSRSAFMLLPVAALVFYIAFIPHQSYAYPLHVDEWVHLARAEAMLKAGSLTYTEPFLGDATESIGSNMEVGFQLFWGVFQRISGISWMIIFRYFPGVIMVFTALCAFILADRLGFGWEAAFFTCLLPTTVGILGPAFLVPVAIALPFVLLSLYIAFYFKSWWSYLVLFVFTCFIVALHPPSAICLVLILLPYGLLNLKGNFRHSLGMALAVLIPFLAPFPWIFGLLLPTAKGLFTQQFPSAFVDFPRVIRTYGYLPLGLCLLGCFVLAFRRGKENYGLALGLLAVLLMLTVFFTFHYGLSIMYERGLMFMMLMLGVVAGAGLAWIRNIGFNEWLNAKILIPKFLRYSGWAFCLVLVGITLYISIPDHQGTPYYHMIDDKDYQTFVWIRDNVSEAHDRAVLDPWKATAFTAITGKHIYTRIHEAPKPSDDAVAEFLEDGCKDTSFLQKKGVSIVYTREPCQNPDLVQVREWVYLLEK
jgi:hypothetical protein